MDDIVTRLRTLREVLMGNPIMAREVQEAMDEIERLRNGIEKYVTTVSDSYCTNEIERDALELLKETWRG